jgi:hypothetical protein
MEASESLFAFVYWTEYVFMTLADHSTTAYQSVATLFHKVEALAQEFSRYDPFYTAVSGNTKRAARGRGADAVMILAVESRMTSIVAMHIDMWQLEFSKPHELPLLYHAIACPTISRLPGKLGFPQRLEKEVPLEIIQILLSRGCNPNEEFGDRNISKPNTPWVSWLRYLRDNSATVKSVETTKLFLEAGANLGHVRYALGEDFETWIHHKLPVHNMLQMKAKQDPISLVVKAQELLDVITRRKSECPLSEPQK